MEGAHPIWSDGSGRFGQSIASFVSAGVKDGVPVNGN